MEHDNETPEAKESIDVSASIDGEPIGSASVLGRGSAKSPITSGVKSERLGVMPLAVLLPRLGDIHQLASMAEKLDKRYRALQAEHSSVVSEGSQSRNREESMLGQILQWLSLGVKDKSS